ncbi:hypothetical protein [Mycolicibacterium rhodesiae]|uniref:Uncharacterized protein n=1 Tax=Mycolicibacterium rhodesiae TaxID=36814 RepID=A0A1X0IRU2_MYCRH|nr:hypothetical protein [Mycolicibacterium rhodesiae]MCV7347681.1 hypothetical protein [Mycolicibacterium rhodesiae]ORB50838.1 hypothetical protein BST42_18930 [Mycolicibacterium rhodesiae]
MTEISFDRWYRPLAAPLGLGPGRCDVSIAAGTLHVSMGWGFSADIPPAQARVVGVPTTLRSLLVSVTDPDALIPLARTSKTATKVTDGV